MSNPSIFYKLKKSKFRRSFHLSEDDFAYIEDKGMDKIVKYAKEIIEKNIKFRIKNDGKQTPLEGHPVFKAQQALALCCRKCIQEWYKIPMSKPLNEEEINYFVYLIEFWIKKEIAKKERRKELENVSEQKTD